MTKIINGKDTNLFVKSQVKGKNQMAWRKDRNNLHKRIRGNCFVVFSRLVNDFKNHLGNLERTKSGSLPFVDADGWLHTTTGIIVHGSGHCMSNKTAMRHIATLYTDADKKVDGQMLIIDYKALAPGRFKVKLNRHFLKFVEDETEAHAGEPPDGGDGHIVTKKVAKRLQNKWLR